MDTTIKQCDQSCIDNIVKLGKATFTETYADQNSEKDLQKYLKESFNKAKITGEMKTPGSFFYIAYIRNIPVGYMKINTCKSQTIQSDEKDIQIERIYVLKKYQGKKIGSMLLNTACDFGIKMGCNYIVVDAWEGSPQAIRFYERNGFKKFGTYVFTLGNSKQEDILMKRKLKNTSANRV